MCYDFERFFREATGRAPVTVRPSDYDDGSVERHGQPEMSPIERFILGLIYAGSAGVALGFIYFIWILLSR